MDAPPIRVLLVDDDEDDYVATHEALARLGGFAVEWVATYERAVERIGCHQHDLYLLDYRLGERSGLELLREALANGCTAPLILLTGQGDREVDLEAMKAGAADYLVKGQLTAALLERSLRYALERHRLQTHLRSLALVDDLTGLYNRRGFLTLAAQQLKIAARSQRDLVLMVADLDGLKQINDTFGHQDGDQALIATAEIFTRTFRASDILARLSGDEFAVLAIEAAKDSTEVIKARLQANLQHYNAQNPRSYTLSFSIGIVVPDLTAPSSVEELLARADQALYEQKRHKREVLLR